MPCLRETVAAALARSRALSATEPPSPLTPVCDFGPNPGALAMRLHLPAGMAAAAPLVVVLHGCGQTAAGYAAGAGWVELADRFGFALLCPQQARSNNANLCFNWFEDGDVRRGAGEAASIAQMVRHTVSEHGLDRRRVFITGLSAGGAMAAAMLACYPELFAGGAVVGGVPYGAATGVAQALAVMRRVPELPAHAWGDKVRAAAPAPARWPRIAVWHGGADTTVTPDAGEALVRQWCDVHGVGRGEAGPGLGAGHAHTAWRGPDGTALVESHRIAGLGHGAPIAANGADGCGVPAPWILEAGVSSSFEIARSWGLVRAGRRVATVSTSAQAAPSRPAARPSPAGFGVEEVINRALRSAGLLRSD